MALAVQGQMVTMEAQQNQVTTVQWAAMVAMAAMVEVRQGYV